MSGEILPPLYKQVGKWWRGRVHVSTSSSKKSSCWANGRFPRTYNMLGRFRLNLVGEFTRFFKRCASEHQSQCEDRWPFQPPSQHCYCSPLRVPSVLVVVRGLCCSAVNIQPLKMIWNTSFCSFLKARGIHLLCNAVLAVLNCLKCWEDESKNRLYKKKKMTQKWHIMCGNHKGSHRPRDSHTAVPVCLTAAPSGSLCWPREVVSPAQGPG